MNETQTETRSVVVEREIAHPPEKIWRALTQPHLIEEWLMKNDFAPVVGHRFDFRADWGSVGCQVLEIEPDKSLSYTWGAMGLESVVTWTLTPSSTGLICGWSKRASDPIRSRPIRAPRSGGGSSLRRLSSYWRGWTDVCRRNSPDPLRRVITRGSH